MTNHQSSLDETTCLLHHCVMTFCSTINQRVNQSINHSINQPTNQPNHRFCQQSSLDDDLLVPLLGNGLLRKSLNSSNQPTNQAASLDDDDLLAKPLCHGLLQEACLEAALRGHRHLLPLNSVHRWKGRRLCHHHHVTYADRSTERFTRHRSNYDTWSTEFWRGRGNGGGGHTEDGAMNSADRKQIAETISIRAS